MALLSFFFPLEEEEEEEEVASSLVGEASFDVEPRAIQRL